MDVRTAARRFSGTALAALAFLGAASVLSNPQAEAATTRDKIVAIAKSELNNDTRNHEVNGCNFYTGQVQSTSPSCPAGWGRNEWCANFAKYIWKTAGNVEYLNELDGWAYSFKNYGIKHGTWHAKGSGYVPRPGDAVVFEWGDGDGHVDHVGIVAGVSSGKVVTIEGNTGNSVVDQHVNPAGIDGYISPIITGGDNGNNGPISGDVTGGGDGDLVMHSRAVNGAGDMWVWQGGNGDGFWATPKMPFSGSAYGARAKMALSDVGGDGINDILWAREKDADTTELRIVKGGTSPSGFGTLIREFNQPFDNIQLAGGDVTGDDKGDLVVYTKTANGLADLYVFQGGNGDGFWATPKVPFSGSAFAANSKITVSDVGGDGTSDIVLARAKDADTTELRVIKGGQNISGFGVVQRDFGRPVADMQLAGGDVTGDGNGDLVVHSRMANGSADMYIFMGGNGDGFWASAKVPFNNTAYAANAKITTSDVGGDGTADIVLVREKDADTSEIRVITGGKNPTGFGEFQRDFNRPLSVIELA